MQREIAGSIPNTNDHQFISCPSQETWPNYPILVRRSPHMISNPCEQYSKPCIIHDPVAANAEIELENEYFIGKAFIAIKGLPDSPEHFKYEWNFPRNLFIFADITPLCILALVVNNDNSRLSFRDDLYVLCHLQKFSQDKHLKCP